jgi:hypothetical protein
MPGFSLPELGVGLAYQPALREFIARAPECTWHSDHLSCNTSSSSCAQCGHGTIRDGTVSQREFQSVFARLAMDADLAVRVAVQEPGALTDGLTEVERRRLTAVASTQGSSSRRTCTSVGA